MRIHLLLLIFVTLIVQIISSCKRADDPTGTDTSNNPPALPSNPEPADSAINISTVPTLRWVCSDPDADTVTYDIYLGLNASPSLLDTDIQNTSYTPRTTLDYDQVYYWMIVARDEHGDSTAGPIWQFSTRHIPNRAPLTPSNPIPANNTTRQSRLLTLRWTSIDQDGDPVTYDVFFGTEHKPVIKISSDQSSSFIAVSGLSEFTRYYWQVTAKDNQGHTNKSPVWIFMTEGAAPVNISEVVFVEGGTFQMGSTGGDAGERPVHTVTLNSFYIDKYEVTVAQYKLFCDSTLRIMPPAPEWGWIDEDPMVNVSWFDAAQYAEWAGKRLPTEAEWEYAARGGILGHGYIYSGDSTLGNVGWYSDNSGGLTHHIGTKAPNELGLYDMSGNVWEWCSDWYGSYTAEAEKNPKGPVSGMFRIMRGGSYAHMVFYCRTTYRYTHSPTATGFESGGFRCIRDY